MKKLIYLSLSLVALCLAASCGGPKTPGEAAKRYTEYMADGSYDKFIDGIAFDKEQSPEEIEKGRTMLKSLLTEKVAPALEEKGGLKTVEIVSEEIAEDGQTAKVVLKQTFGDGTTEEETSKMVLVDGVWKMQVNK